MRIEFGILPDDSTEITLLDGDTTKQHTVLPFPMTIDGATQLEGNFAEQFFAELAHLADQLDTDLRSWLGEPTSATKAIQ